MIVGQKDQTKPLAHYFFRAESAKRVFGALETGITLVNSYFIISTLSVFSFGLYQLILSFISILRGIGINFFDGLVTLDMRRYFNLQRPDLAKKLFKENIFFKLAAGALMAAAVFFGSDIVANFYGKDISILIKWASILLLTSSFQSLISIFLQSVVSFSQQGVSAFREFIKLALIIGFLLLHRFTITEVFIAHVVAEGIATFASSIFIFIKMYQKAFRNVQSAPEPLMIPMVKNHGPRIFAIFGMKEILQDITPWLINFFVNTEGVGLYSLSLSLVAFIQDFMPLSGIKPILALKADKLDELAYISKVAVKYVFWIGSAFLIISVVAVPPLVVFIFPKYTPAIPVFISLTFGLPLYGVAKILHTILASLREYKVLARRLLNELIILIVGSVIFLPTIGITGIGIIYLARYIERTWFLYSQLTRHHPEFKIKLHRLFRFDKTDKQFASQLFSQFRGLLPSIKRN